MIDQWQSGSGPAGDQSCWLLQSACRSQSHIHVHLCWACTDADSIHWHCTVGIQSIRSQGRPAPSFYRTTSSHYKLHELCKTSDYSIYMYYVLFFSQCPKHDFVNSNTLYAIFPQMYVVVTCNCATNMHFSQIRCRNQIRVNINSLWRPS